MASTRTFWSPASPGPSEPFSGIIAVMDRPAESGRLLVVRAACVVLAALLGACARDPIPCVSSLDPGDLAVAEVRGKQTNPSDPLGQWVEVCNATASRLPLAGVVLAFTRLDGSGERQVLVRDRALAVDPGRCAVLGLFAGSQSEDLQDANATEASPDGATLALPDHADYDFSDQWDLASGLYDAAVLEVRACGQVVDRVVYRDLPDGGTWSLDGRVAPDAAANDDESSWCVDAAEADRGYPGTPGERNRECDASGG